MSVFYLWKFYLENDLDSFQRLLLSGSLLLSVPSGSQKRQQSESVGGAAASAIWASSGHQSAAGLWHAESGGSLPDNSINDHNSRAGSLPKQIRHISSTSKAQKEAPIIFTQKMFKECDHHGRSLLHLMATERRGLPFLKVLLKHREIDVNHPDAESGWTAFHRALYYGNIAAAKFLYDTEAEKVSMGLGTWPPLLVRMKDKGGEAPFDVFEASVDGLESALLGQHHSAEAIGDASLDGDEGEGQSDLDAISQWWELPRKKGFYPSEPVGDEVFTFGSNKNFTLGFPDQEDRRFPDRVPIQRPKGLREQLSGRSEQKDGINAVTTFQPLYIQDIQLSKLHTAILTSDAHSNLYICGHGGRLGLGDEQLTQFTPRLVSIGSKPYKVAQVALGLDHTVAVLSNGEVWTWGGNKFGQLGYSTKAEVEYAKGRSSIASLDSKLKNKKAKSSTAEEADLQCTPRQVTANLKGEFIVGAAASRIHTVIYTPYSLFTFGKNEGQLGIIESLDGKLLAFESSPREVAASFLAGKKIVMVAATEKSTIVMLGKHEVWILASYGYSKIQFPLTSAWPSTSAFGGPHMLHAAHVAKITCGKDTLCALTNTGDVYTVNLVDMGNSRGPTSGGKLSLPTPVKVWTALKKHLEVIDVGVGEDGNVIICTKSGSVWRRVKRTNKKDLPTLAPNIGSITPSSGATTQLGERRSREYKFSRVSGLTRVVTVRANDFGAYAAIRRDTDIMRLTLKVGPPTLWDDIITLLSFRGAYFSSNNTEKEHRQFMAFLLSSNMEALLRGSLAHIERENGFEGYDMEIKLIGSDISLPIHKAIVAARCPFIRPNLGVNSRPGIFNIGAGAMRIFVPKGPGRQVQIIFEGINLLAIVFFVYYLYTDTTAAILHHYTGDSRIRQLYRDVQTQLDCISNMLHMRETLITGDFINLTLDKDLEAAFFVPDYLPSGDLIIQLHDGAETRVHSIIMRARSPFFQTLYEGAGGRWLAHKEEQMKKLGKSIIEVDMKHVSLNVFMVVLLHMYTDKSDGLFDGVKCVGNLQSFLDFIMDVMGVADELLMDRLSAICQKALGTYVNTRNACQLLNVVAPVKVKLFKDMCLQYICLNLETMLENGHLDDLHEDLVEELCEVVLKDQQLLHPVSRGGKQERELLREYPDLLKSSEEERRLLIESYTYNSCERYHTLHDDSIAPIGSLKSKSYMHKANEVEPLPVSTIKSKPACVLEKNPSVEHVADEIFNMEDVSNNQATPRKTAREPNRTLTKQEQNCINSDGVFSCPAPSLSNSESLLSTSSTLASHLQQQPVTSSSRPWGGISTIAPAVKVDMKEIMGEASAISNRESVSLGHIRPPLSSIMDKKDEIAVTTLSLVPTPKVSQKERKRQQMQKQQSPVPQPPQNPQTIPSQKPKTTPWQTPPARPRLSLKDILDPTPADATSSGFTSGKKELSDESMRGSAMPADAQTSQPSPVEQKSLQKQESPQMISTQILHQPSQRNVQSQTSLPASSPSNQHAGTLTFLPSSHSSSKPSTSTKQKVHPISVPATSSESVFPPLNSPASPQPAEPPLHLSLVDIISQQQAERDIIKGSAMKRSLVDIQEEQAFIDWWERESRRVQGIPDPEPNGEGNGMEMGQGRSDTRREKEKGDNKSRRGNGKDGKRGKKGDEGERLATLTINLGDGSVEHSLNGWETGGRRVSGSGNSGKKQQDSYNRGGARGRTESSYSRNRSDTGG